MISNSKLKNGAIKKRRSGKRLSIRDRDVRRILIQFRRELKKRHQSLL